MIEALKSIVDVYRTLSVQEAMFLQQIATLFVVSLALYVVVLAIKK